jgi:histidyl-tRNA synthetase
MSKPSIPQGTRDFAPQVVRKRQYILDTLRVIFELYGFQPLETPAMENLTTLTGKYGEEGDRLIFKVLNNGLHEKKDNDKEKLRDEWEKMLAKPYTTPLVTERALRYDLTIPFARFVVMNQNDLAFPFKRYQMQPVWRADRPQKGRYREFWQCDADVVGSNSLINEAELLCIYQQAFHKLGIPVKLKINSRKLLTGIAALCGAPNLVTDITIALDKLDKIGWQGVATELTDRGIAADGIAAIERVIAVKGTNEERLVQYTELFADIPEAQAGIAELRTSLHYYSQLADSNWGGTIEVDISLARGLNYYTGVIVEVVCSSEAVKMGSIGGGGRYDDLTGLFGLKGLSGVGVSFGIDRMYDVMEELQLFPQQLAAGTKAFLLNYGGANEVEALSLLKACRAQGMNAELYPDSSVHEDKQVKYAKKRELHLMVIINGTERFVKNFATGAKQAFTTETEAMEAITAMA